MTQRKYVRMSEQSHIQLRFWHALRLPTRMVNLLKQNTGIKGTSQLFRLPPFLRFYAQ